MLVVLNKEEFDDKKIIISDKTKNNIITNGFFYRIMYNDTFCCLNGIYIKFKLKNIRIEPYFNKLKCNFNKDDNNNIIDFLISLERSILSNITLNDYTPKFRIEEQLQQQYIKLYSNNENNFFITNEINITLKISGIWSEQNMYGITFRFFLPVSNIC